MTDPIVLTQPEQAFILSWAEAVMPWGLSRSAGRLHGLLLISAAPLAADQMAATLAVARSNISASLRDLSAMGLIETAPQLGDRREHFRAVSDPDAMTAAVIAAQKARLFDPAHAALAASGLSRLAPLAAEAAAWEARISGAELSAKPKKKKKKKS